MPPRHGLHVTTAEASENPPLVLARRHVEDFRAAWERSGLTYDRDVSELIDARAGEATLAASLSGRRCVVATRQTDSQTAAPGFF